MRIVVTNDDGIDSVGLHVLVQAIAKHGDVVVVAPDSEYSGAGAAVGALHLIRPEVHKRHVDGAVEAYAVTGPPALCTMFTRMGVFGPQPDLLVSGINPGANVGRSVYHSGTIGAALTARNGNVTGVAISQETSGFAIEGQGMEEVLAQQLWSTAGHVADLVVGALAKNLPSQARVLNVNVPNLPVKEIKGWRYAEVGTQIPRSIQHAALEPRPGHENSYWVKMRYGDKVELPFEVDGGTVEAGYVALTWLSRIHADDGVTYDDSEMRGGLDSLALSGS